MSDAVLRPATADDRPFLAEMMLAAINWLPEREMSLAEAMSDPAINHYVDGWKRDNELGVIATDASGQPIGACWLTYLDSTDPGYGYFADDVPELSISMVAAWRRRGVGRQLVRATLDMAREAGIERVSLSVEHGNAAVKLYTDEGFHRVGTDEGADTMVVTL